MLLFEMFEQQESPKHAAFCFGRMNPPTVGHGQLINTVAKASQGGDYFIFVSQTQDSKKNPLDYATKVKFIKALFPQQAGHVVYNPELKTIMQVAEWLYNAGYRSVTFAAGSDRLDSFKKLLTDYNGKEGGNVYYKFDSINFVSSGDRDPDADGIAGVSASSAREAASQGNLEAFAQATGAGKLAQPLYDAVRKGMLLEGLTESDEIDSGKIHNLLWSIRQYLGKAMPDVGIRPYDVGTRVWTRGDGTRHRDPARLQFHNVEERDQAFDILSKALTGARATQVSGEFGSDPHQEALVWKGKVIGKHGNNSISLGSASRVTNPNSVWREKPVAESASGYIPKNKKEAKDPRWSNALTVDVHPDTPYKNMKALGLI